MEFPGRGHPRAERRAHGLWPWKSPMPKINNHHPAGQVLLPAVSLSIYFLSALSALRGIEGLVPVTCECGAGFLTIEI